METVFKALLPLFIGMALIGCAGTDSSVQTKVDEKPNLFKAGTTFADTLASRMPEFAHSIFKSVIDSVPGEYYYHTTDGRIDTLFKKESGQHKPIVSIAYDFPNEQNSYELKKGTCSYIVKEGTLETELDFPKYLKKYWGNGKLKKVLTGNLYVDDQGNIALNSGREEKYFKSGKIQWQDDWRDKQVVAGKEWNENGVLVAELDFPKYLKKYWGNGKTKEISTGLLYINDQGVLRLDSGHAEFYFENGKINEQSDLKNKQAIGTKVWNKDGVLIKEIDFPKCAKEYWNNGKLKGIMTGLLYRDNQGNTSLDSGHSESYFENGQVHQQNDWKDKKLIAQKEWNEKGVLIKELDFPNYSKEYWDNGEKKVIATGTLYRNDKGIIKVDSGHGEIYFENGKIYQQNDWKDKQSIVSKEWNKNGVLVTELEFPKYIKQYWDDGKPKIIAAGFLYRDKQGIIKVDSGYSELYFENGKIKELNDWKDKQVIACKRWNERGYLIKENAFPKYVREYWDNGKPKAVLTGILYRDDQGDFRIDSGNSETYFENGKNKEKNDWKDKLPIAHKEWNEKGSLIKEVVFPKYAKEYYDNGKLKKEITGLYRESPTNLESENGYKKEYYANGKIKEHINYKNKEPYSSKQWNEDGALSTEWDISAGYYKYYENGTLRLEAKGFKGFTGEKGVLVENGYQILYFNNGKPQAQEQFKDKKIIGKKIWDENGTLIIEKDILKGFYKAYFPSGKISRDISGKFHYENKKIIFEDCSVKSWYENGQTEILLKYKDKKLISKKYWYENGNIAFSAELPNHYKVFYEDGKIKANVTGTLVEENGDFKIKDGVYNEYDQNGEVTASTTYKDFQIISEKK